MRGMVSTDAVLTKQRWLVRVLRAVERSCLIVLYCRDQERSTVLFRAKQSKEPKKGMIVFAWCIMPSHLHLMFKSTIQAPHDLLRDFKSFTSKGIVKKIQENPQESRKEWMLNSFKKAALNNSNNTLNQFWQQHNQPIEVWSNEVIDQKKNYIHQNPIEAGFVENDYEYLYSSARDYADIKGLVNIEKI
jgi:REP element-mobilizing transposase RayT